ncbi:uncharacterized protein LOC119770108 [Culex quinquefasciatus]|uniref:uncharacterized protein LOC119770108 n=1 Tax=Culex quinquefasciatus TaxID=7176 RepID=UPI0018E394A1|nr:uncharacterized protein LOC119770108 [Culex quinquefasciatus]
MQSFRKKTLLLQALVILATLHGHVAADDSGNAAEEGRFLFWGKPFLIVPPTAPTRHQLISGIGIPLGTPESITTGWVIKAQYFLPTTVDNLKPLLWEGWNDTRRSLGKREVGGQVPGDHYEKYEAKEVKIETEKLPDEVESLDEDDDEFDDGDDNYWLDDEEVERFQEADQRFPPNEMDAKAAEGYNAGQSRWITYKTLEKVGERYGAGGRPCVLRSICEAAAAEFTHSGGVFAELMHIIFTPSTTTESLSEHNDNEYYRAEQLGREGAPCEQVFHECKQSILDVFTGVHDPATNSMSVAHQKLLQAMMK